MPKGEDARRMAADLQARFAPELDACLKRLGENDEEIKKLREERDSLKYWRESALEVEREWDPQALGKLLNLPLGSKIRAGLMAEIPKLLNELAFLKEYRAMAVDREQAIRNEANVQRARANTAERCFEQLRDALKQMPK